MRHATIRLLLAAATATASLIAAAPAAHAGLGTWTSLSGLTAAGGASWVREYTRASPPNVTHLYAATEGDGVYRSTNSGLSWAPFNAGLEGVPAAKQVRTVYADGANRMLAGTSAGLFVSTSGGAWQPLAQGPEQDPNTPKNLNTAVQALFKPTGGPLLAGGFSSGVFRSNDNGATWIPPQPGNGMPAATTVWQLASLIPGVVFAATSSGVYRSANNGATWSLSSDGIPGTTLRIFADGTNPNIFYAGTAGDGVYRSLNLGVTWSPINGSGAKALGNSTIRGLVQVNGVNQTRLYAATADGLWGGTTGNGPLGGPTTWRKISPSGLGANTILWTVSDLLPGNFVVGTQSNGGYVMTLVPPSNQVAPQVSGTLKVGKTLTTNTGVWNGTATIEYEYQWQRCTSTNANTCSDIDDAEASTHVPTTTDFGKYVRAVVTASNDVPTFGLTKAETAIVGPIGAADGSLPGDNQQSAATISGPSLPQSGQTLTAANWLFNPAAAGTSFRWYRCTNTNENSCSLIPGVTSISYQLTDADVERRIRVRVVGTNQFGTTTLGFSGATNTIFPQAATNVVPPSLLGTAQAGQSLVALVGAWKFPGTTFQRQWYRCEADGGSCQTLGGEKAATYTLGAADVGKRLKAEIVADSNGANVFPAPVSVFTPLSDVVSAAPTGVPAGPPPAGDQPAGGGGAAGTTPQRDTTAPRLTAASLSAATIKRGGSLTVAFRPSEGGRVRIEIQSLTKGRKRGARCSAKATSGKRCTIVKTVVTKSVAAGTGAAKLKIALKARGKRLKAGRYQARITPIDAAGNRGAAKVLPFRITR